MQQVNYLRCSALARLNGGMHGRAVDTAMFAGKEDALIGAGGGCRCEKRTCVCAASLAWKRISTADECVLGPVRAPALDEDAAGCAYDIRSCAVSAPKHSIELREE